MGLHSIAHACGHTATVNLFGRRADRESRARWLAERSCGSCRQEEKNRERAEENERCAQANQAAGLPALTGSPKQVAWAETIRADLLSLLDQERTGPTGMPGRGSRTEAEDGSSRERRGLVETAHTALSEITEARWFIDHQSSSVLSLSQLVRRGRLRPRTVRDKEVGFTLSGLNRLTFPAGEVVGWELGGQRVRLRLVSSRWEGCSVVHPASMTQEEPDGAVTVRFGGEWTLGVSDGARTRAVTAEAFYLDRVNRQTEPGERHFWGPPRYTPGEWNEFDVPEGEVTEQEDSDRELAVVQLACSRWEGLHFKHPVSMTRRHRPGFVTVRFGPRWDFTLLGGERTLRVNGQEVHADRTAPLPQPGPSLAVEPTLWHSVRFHPFRVFRTRDKDAWAARFPLESAWPQAVVFHRDSVCRQGEDGFVVWRFHDDWHFRVRTPDSGTVELSAEEFLAATVDWAGRAPVPGTYVREPDRLVPDGEINVPDELREDDPFLAGDESAAI